MKKIRIYICELLLGLIVRIVPRSEPAGDLMIESIEAYATKKRQIAICQKFNIM